MRARKLTRSWIFFLILAAFVVGVGVASYSNNFFVQSIFGLLTIFIVGRFFSKTDLQILLLTLLVCAAAFAGGIIRYDFANPTALSVRHLPDTYVTFQGSIESMRVSESHQQLTIGSIQYGDEKRSGNILAFVPVFPELRAGIDVQVSCELSQPEPFQGFAYDRFLAARNTYKTCFTHDTPVILGQPRSIQAAFWKVKNDAIDSIRRSFDEPHATLLAGLLLGERGFQDTWDEAFIRTGTSHIVAASGYNVTIVSFILFGLLTWFGVKRQTAFPLLLVGIASYVLLVGADAPIIRAGIMGALVLTARFLGRQTTMRNILLLTAVIMLTQNPLLLRDDVAFQLSILSTIGLVYLAPFFEKRLQFIPSAFTIRESFVATLAATVTTLPIILTSFGQLSTVSPFVNLLILPIVPYAMLFGVLAISIPKIGFVFAGIAWLLLEIILFVIASISQLGFASISISEPIAYAASILYVAIFILCVYFYKKSLFR